MTSTLVESLRDLAEAGKFKRSKPPKMGSSDVSKRYYGDRGVIDYWRTIGGVNVGFVGDPGEGVAKAGPASLTGATSPLHKDMTKKYEGTWVGRALNKKNMPKTVAPFIHDLMGGEDPAERGEKLLGDLEEKYGDEWKEGLEGFYYNYDSFSEDEREEALKKEIEDPASSFGKVNEPDVGFIGYCMDKEHGGAYHAFRQWYASSSDTIPQAVCGLLSDAGVASNPVSSEFHRSRWVGDDLRDFEKEERDGMMGLMKDLYSLSQHYEKKGTGKDDASPDGRVRHRGVKINPADYIPEGIESYELHSAFDEITSGNIESGIFSREMASFGSASTAVSFGNVKYSTFVPREAMLVSDKLGIGYSGERESVVMGASEMRGVMRKDDDFISVTKGAGGPDNPESDKALASVGN